jgi:hypothetical protein
MPHYHIVLTDGEDIALAWITERVNATRIHQVDADGEPMDALAPADVLQGRVSEDMERLLTSMDATLTSLLDHLRAMDAPARRRALDRLTSVAEQDRLEMLLEEDGC